MNYHSLMVFSMSEMVSSISSSVSLLSSILVNVRLKIVMSSSSLVIHEVNVFLTVRILVSYLDRRLLIWFNIHFLMMYLIMVGFLFYLTYTIRWKLWFCERFGIWQPSSWISITPVNDFYNNIFIQKISKSQNFIKYL